MDDEGLVRKLKERGYSIGRNVVRDDGLMLWLINDVFMFRPDAVDLASGVVSLEDVLWRNRGKVFPKAPPTELEKFQDRVFQEMKDLEEAQKRKTVEDLLTVAKERGLTIDDVLRIIDTRGKQGILGMLNANKSNSAQ
jgi:hypothetical protein